ncbi:MAG: hypothetical protein JHD35_26640 [Sphingopyxis sp.]|nr:hypothetical protein [Sphingopyxis sp.]
MTFRPFGFSFEVHTALDPVESRQRVRECKHPLLHPDNGPRGFVLGRFICLWSSLFDSGGPMLIGWLRNDERGCRIVGRAGTDLNGTLYLAIVGAMIPAIVLMAFHYGDTSWTFHGLMALCFLALVFMLALASRDRKSALPLVRFLETATGGRSSHEFGWHQ